MKLGIFAKTFHGSGPSEILARVRDAGFTVAHYNMACSGLPSMPDAIELSVARTVGQAAKETGIELVAVSGTYNMIHPDPGVRERGNQGLRVLAAACRPMGTRLISLCTGTRDPEDQWWRHPDNDSSEAWRDLLASMEAALEVAETFDVHLGVEPELANVVNSARRARRLIDELASPRIRIILDPANLFEVETAARQREIVSDAIELLADRIAMAHAKDRRPDGGFTIAGHGVVDYPHFIRKLRANGFDGPLVAHGLPVEEAPQVATFLKSIFGRFARGGNSMTGSFSRPGAPSLSVSDSGGGGAPFVFQHGLCGDSGQTAEVFPRESGLRRLTLECRGHGGSEAGDPERFSIATFSDDLISLIESEGLGPCVVGGISMGAAIALRIAVVRPDLVRGLVLARPAWVVEDNPVNMAPNAVVGDLLARHEPDEARRLFEQSREVAELATTGPDNLASLRGFFEREPIAVTAALLSRISADGPGVTEERVARIPVPTLVIGSGRDAVHPLSLAERLAALIPEARLVVVASKADDRERHVAEFRAALRSFLTEIDS